MAEKENAWQDVEKEMRAEVGAWNWKKQVGKSENKESQSKAEKENK